ncbi:MAG TPA: exodeoxyribonuclease V subunit alpha, partial [Spirochaetota bacterium]|nr:exodeoxyribonuclease V subunit alpha [Spirochaetota bacterium]
RLPYDVVIVDESSMVDIALLAKLIKALKEGARFIVVGDKDQLSSVEAGAFFGDLCWGVTQFGYTSQWNKTVAAIKDDDAQQLPSHPVRDAIVVLSKAYRFGADSGIAVLAQAVRDADMHKVDNVLKNSYNDVEFIQYSSIDEIHTIIKEYAKQHYESVAIAHNVSDAFSKISHQCIVTPFNQGPWGVSTLNAIIEKQINPLASGWYHGKIIMVTANDYNLQLFNGDMGIFVNNDDGESGVCFPLEDSYRKINPLLLSEYIPAYTITIHKSQGSEFNTVIVVLPNDINSRWSMLLTRELLYTAITRAKEKLIIYGTHDVIAYMVNNPTKRASGIQGKVWQ